MPKTKASMAIQVLPKTTTDKKLVEVVDKVIANIIDKNLKYEVSAFETTIEAELDDLLLIIKESLEICIQEGAPSVMTYIKINYCPDGVMSIEDKIEKYQ